MEHGLINLILIMFGVTILGMVIVRFKMPIIIAYIIAGLILGVSGLNIIKDQEQIKFLSQIGLTLLLFIVGLKLDASAIKTMGNAFKLGVYRVLICVGFGFILCIMLRFSLTVSIYVALSLAFSSTIAIIKILSDKKELDSLAGRLALGVLLVEDLVAVLAMIFITSINNPVANGVWGKIFELSKYGFIIFAIIFILTKYIIPKCIHRWAKSPELLMLVSIAFAVIMAGICEYAGFSMEVGAFIAGMSLAPYKEYRYTISAKLSGLRDFTLIFFFVKFGIGVNLEKAFNNIDKVVILLFFIVVVTPIFVSLVIKFFGYKRRTQIIAALYLSQISEFSIILLEFGHTYKQVDETIISIMGLVMLLSILVSTLYMNYSQNIYLFLDKIMNRIGIKLGTYKAEEEISVHNNFYNIVIFGLSEFGSVLSDCLTEKGAKILEIDFDPLVVKRRKSLHKNIIYGDAEDLEFLSHLDFSGVVWIINSISILDNRALIKALKSRDYVGHYAVKSSEDNKDAIKDTKGIDLIFEPYVNAAWEAVEMIKEKENEIKIQNIKERIESTSDHYIVCGFGRMGRQIVKDLMNENVPCVIIDENKEHEEELLKEDYNYISGNAASDQVLIEAGIKRAKGLIAVYPTDALNVFIVLTAKNLNFNLDIVARSIQESNEDKLKKAGANKVISPYMFGGRKMASAILRPAVFEFNELTYHGNEYDIVFEELFVDENSFLLNKSIKDSDFRQKYGVTIIAIRRANGEMVANPDFNTLFKLGDIVVVICTQEQLTHFRESDDFVVKSSWNA